MKKIVGEINVEKQNINIIKFSDDANVPTYGTEFSAGADLYACINENITIKPGQTVMIPTGIGMEIQIEYAGFIYARSGLSTKQGLAPANKVGVVDADYRGEIKVALYNQSSEDRVVSKNDRIAQIVIAPFLKADFKVVDSLSDTTRGDGGFGHTGKN